MTNNINEIKYDNNKKSIIVFEGPQGVGKTGFANYCREIMPYSNLLRLSGTSDKTKTGYDKAKKMYEQWYNMLKSSEQWDINWIFDRYFFSEELFCRNGYKQYTWSDVYWDLVNKFNETKFNLFVIFLYLEQTELYRERLKRNKPEAYNNMTINESVKQQDAYLKMAEELKSYNNINVITIPTDDFNIAYQKLHKILPPLETKIK